MSLGQTISDGMRRPQPVLLWMTLTQAAAAALEEVAGFGGTARTITHVVAAVAGATVTWFRVSPV